jgi:hypothetical protein
MQGMLTGGDVTGKLGFDAMMLSPKPFVLWPSNGRLL